MRRADIRKQKRDIRAGIDTRADPDAKSRGQLAALSLLQRSVEFGHTRLALRRLEQAVDTGVFIPAPYWAYCCQVVSTLGDNTVKKIYLDAATRAERLRCDA